MRGLLLGTAIGNSATIAIAWCVVITLASYLWARKLYNRDPDPPVARRQCRSRSRSATRAAARNSS